jgi:N-acetyl-1-D-myo-inositol-2-amino-2-deoxy-alpha-D-glucopyranoside deacetylase
VLRLLGIAAPGSAIAGADAGPDIKEIGVPDGLVTTIIDVQRYIDAKRAALACHASQFPPDHFLMRMPLDVARRLWAVECYSLEAGPRTTRRGRESDLFDGLE